MWKQWQLLPLVLVRNRKHHFAVRLDSACPKMCARRVALDPYAVPTFDRAAVRPVPMRETHRRVATVVVGAPSAAVCPRRHCLRQPSLFKSLPVVSKKCLVCPSSRPDPGLLILLCLKIVSDHTESHTDAAV
jgi:hypothetical protein